MVQFSWGFLLGLKLARFLWDVGVLTAVLRVTHFTVLFDPLNSIISLRRTLVTSDP